MRFSVERIRLGLLVGAGLLVVVIAGFLEFAHYKAHRIIADLPKRLGATITREFNNYTYSQSYQGKTVFTIHAGKGVEHKDGKMGLHDVDLTMYGRKGDRADHISGAEFEYDEKTQVVRALGIVHMDLQAPPAQEAVALGVVPGKGAKPSPKAGATDRVVHITTSGLVYRQKEGLATTDQEIEFTFGGLAGKAMGAEYNSVTGHVVLQSAVTMHGVEHGQAVLLTANHGEFDRQAELATLQHARYSSGGETAEAEVGLIHLREDGSAERIEGEQHVRLERADEGVVTADRGEMSLDPQSKPTLAVLTGTVRYMDDQPLRQGNGSAAKATLHFDGQGRVEHVLLNGGAGREPGRVESTERVRTAAAAGWSQRELSAETVELALAAGAPTGSGAAGAAGAMELKAATAVGSARLNSVPAGGSEQWSRLSGDRLEAKFVAPHGQTEVSTVHGVGHTVLDQMGAKGIEQVSQGDSLVVNFREAKKTVGARESGAGANGAGSSAAVEVATAVQDGHVAMTRTVPAAASGSNKVGVEKSKAAGPEVQHARADRASFDQDTNLLTLAGSAELWDAASRVTANKVVMEQGSGDATADGAVKVTYQQAAASQTDGSAGQASGQASGQQPTHILAERAELLHDAGRATFYGAPAGGGVRTAGGAKLARLWQSGTDGQGGSQVEAPVLILEQGAGQGHGRLTARGVGAGAPMAVRTVLVSAPGKARVQESKDGQVQKQVSTPKPGAGAKRGAGSGAALPGSGQTQVVRVTSREMVYSEETRQAEFSGGVRVLDGDGDLRAQQATVFLQAAASGPAKAGGASGVVGLTSGGVERVVATGQVDMTEPGRHATGDRLVYTASDQMFVLTGTVANPPKVVDAQQGTATGASLRFHSGDDAVVISGEGGAAGQKVRTETKVKQ